ncbi:MAG: AAA family ATPase [Candidatus Bathyarchaeia archaeon]
MSCKKALGIVGMPGSGKSVVREVAEKMGYATVVMGDVVRDEVRNRGLKLTPENLWSIMLEIRREFGPEVVAVRSLEKIKQLNGEVILIDGIRSLDEVELFRKFYPDLKIIAVHSSPKTRFKRLKMRGREDDPRCWEEFCERDRRELEVGIGDVIALSDFIVVNEGTKEYLERKVTEVLRKVVENG